MTDKGKKKPSRGKLRRHDTASAADDAQPVFPARLEKRDGGGARGSRFSTTKVEVEGREETKIVELPSLELEPWADTQALSIVGTAVSRADALEKVTGRARYTADERPPGVLHAVIIRAPIARGQVTRLDLTSALSSPGVRGALTRDDVPEVKLDGVQLFDPAIGYMNHPLAAICAESLDEATRALALVVLETAEEANAATAEQALASGAPAVRPNGNAPRNMPRVASRGDVEAGLRDADVTVSREYRTPTALHTALEPHGAVADWTGAHLSVWESTQGIFMTRADLSRNLKMPLSRIRVMKNYMGGGFGAKNGAPHSTYIAALLARKLNAPVSCMLDREGEQSDAGNRPATVQRVTIGAKRDGTLTAIVMDATIALGIGGWQAGPGKIYHELYRCPNVRTSEMFVYTNAGAMSSFRAPGHTEGAFGLECAMDAVARELAMDPLELRRHNYAETDQDKKRPYSQKRLNDCYDAGAKRFGWTARSGGGPASDTKRRGMGMASVVWGAGGGPPAYASVRLNRDGSIDVLTGSQDLGTGSRTILAQIAAEQLGARVEDVRTVLGDTERLPFAPNSWGSITTASVGPAIRVAAEEARQVLFEAAGTMLNSDPDALESSASVIRVRGSDRSMKFEEVCEKLGDVMISGHGSRGANPNNTARSAFAAQFAEVEVDILTGQVRVLRIVSAHDSGRIINPTLATSQVEGGVIQGLGYALFEERVLDERSGMPLNPTMHDYKIPTMADIPAIETIFVGRSDSVANHTGAKGLSEPPMIGVAPAIANAVANAIGAEVTQIPITPWRVLDVLS